MTKLCAAAFTTPTIGGKHKIPKILETYLDGLDALVDGRGFNRNHEMARRYVAGAVGSFTVHCDALKHIAFGKLDADAMRALAKAALAISK